MSTSTKRKRTDTAPEETATPDTAVTPSDHNSPDAKKPRLTTEKSKVKPRKRPEGSVRASATKGLPSKATQAQVARDEIAVGEEDQAMLDADDVDTGDNFSDDQAPQHTAQHKATSQQAAPQPQAVPGSLPLVRADDPTNNPHLAVIADPQTRTAYLQVVGTRTLYITSDPMQALNSACEEKLRYIIKKLIFDSCAFKDCIDGYNNRGGNVKKFQSIEKAYKSHAKTWFAEENIVLPWHAMCKDERKRLTDMNLGPEHFPTLISSSGINAAGQPTPRPQTSKRVSKKADLQQAPKPAITTKTPPGSMPSDGVASSRSTYNQQSHSAYIREGARQAAPIREAHSGGNEAETIKSKRNQEPGRPAFSFGSRPSMYEALENLRRQQQVSEDTDDDENDDGVEHHEDDVDIEDDDRNVEMEEEDENTEVEEESDVDSEEDDDDDADSVHISDRIHAVANVFNKASARIRVDEAIYKIDLEALYTYCGAVRRKVDEANYPEDLEVDLEIDLSGFSPKIVRAFIQAISPLPSNALPVHDFAFDQEPLQGPNAKDVFGIMDEERVPTSEVVWDMEACLQMRDLAATLECPIVKDMVADEIFEQSNQLFQEKKEHPDLERDDPEISLEYLNSLTSDEDAPFIRLVRDCLRMHAQGDLAIPEEEMADHVRKIMEELPSGALRTQQDRCKRYHTHGEHNACHLDLVPPTGPETMTLIRDTMAVACKKSSEAYAAKLNNLRANEPRDQYSEEVLRLEGDLMTWSLKRQEKVAEALLTIDVHQEHIANSDGADRKKYRKSLKLWKQRLALLRADYQHAWAFFENGWVHERREPDTDDEDEEEVFVIGGGSVGPKVRCHRRPRSSKRRSDGSWTLAYFFSQVVKDNRLVPARPRVPTLAALRR